MKARILRFNSAVYSLMFSLRTASVYHARDQWEKYQMYLEELSYYFLLSFVISGKIFNENKAEAEIFRHSTKVQLRQTDSFLTFKWVAPHCGARVIGAPSANVELASNSRTSLLCSLKSWYFVCRIASFGLETWRLKLVSSIICSNTMVMKMEIFKLTHCRFSWSMYRRGVCYNYRITFVFLCSWSFLPTYLNVITVVEIRTVHTIFLSINASSTWDDKNAV